ncbi:MAG: ribulokinase, partial [Staphylococcus equorum]
AILGAICGGAHTDFSEAVEAMKEPVLYTVEPQPDKVEIYKKLFNAYQSLHDLNGYKKASIMRDVAKLM